MKSSSSSSATRHPAKRSKSNPKIPVQRSPFTNFGSYMSEKNRKLRSQFEAKASSSSLGYSEPSSSVNGKGIFNGVSIFVDGYTVPSSQELRGYMLRHGGSFENYFSRQRVTHIVCSNLPDSKLRNLRAFSRGLPVVKPAWVVDSVAANKILSWSPYQLVDHLSRTCKQLKLSTFFGCKSIPCVKDDKVAPDSNEGMDCKCLEKSISSPLPLESEVLNRGMQGSERFAHIGHKEEPQLDKGTEVDTSDSSSVNLSIHMCSHADDEHFSGPMDVKCVEAFDAHHSNLTDPNFVENYFKYSRLHFIGTWRNRYRKRFSNVLKRVECSKDNVVSFSSTKKSSIIHIDMDCFFVSVVLRKFPELLDKPVAVCHSNNSNGTAEISSANYPARHHGIRAGMFVRDAKACCPSLVVFPYDFGAYEEVANQFYSILHKHCHRVQALSCDEAFLDITECESVDPESFALLIRREIAETTQCTASAGIAGNKLMARLATKSAKPNGQCFIPPEKVESFLEDLLITELPGIGRALGDKLETRKIHTCGQLRMVQKEALHKDFGAKIGAMLWNYCRGIDNRKVEVLKETKSIGAEVNWGVRFHDTLDCEHFLINLSKEAASRLQECGVVARTVNLKIKKRKKGANEPVKFMGCGECDNLSRSMTLRIATAEASSIQRIAKKIFASFHIDVKEVRGVGLHMSRLEIVEASRQGHRHNFLESWLALPAQDGEESVRLRDDAEPLTSSEGWLHENSQLCIDKAACSDTLHSKSCSSRSHENANSALPPFCDIDMSVIKDLPAEIISEMNDAYNGKLYDLMRKYDEDENNRNLLITPWKVLGGEALKYEGHEIPVSTSCELTHPKNVKVSEMKPHQVRLPTVSGSKTNILQIKKTKRANQMDSAPGSSSKAVSFMQHFSEDASWNKTACAHEDLDHFVSVAGDTLTTFPHHIGYKSEESKFNLWSGNPPHWVEKFEVSNCLILNLIAQLYAKTGSDGLLSPVLQSLISLYPSILGSNSEEPVEALCDLCELLLQYIHTKIETDIEELYLCCRLLERLTSMSNVFSQVYSIVLPPIQVSVSENYGGKLQLSGSRD